MLHQPELTGSTGNAPILDDYYYYLATGGDTWLGNSVKADKPSTLNLKGENYEVS